MCALPFGPRTPPNGAEHRLCPSAGRAQVRLRAEYSVQSLSYRCTAGRSKWQWYWTCISDGSRLQTWWIIVLTWNLSPCHTSCRTVAQSTPLPFITYHGTIPMPTSWQTTSRIRRPAVAGCARKDVAQVVWNGSCVSNRHNRKLSQNALNGDDIENRFPVIELI